MALPQTIDPASPAGTDSPAQGDDQLRGIKQAIIDIFGVPSSPTAVTVAAATTDGAGNFGVGGSITFGTSAVGVLALKTGTAPTTAPADEVQFWSADIGGAGTAGPKFMIESTEVVIMGGVIARGVGAPFAEIVSTASETSIFSSAPTIQGGTLGTSRTLRLVLHGDFLNNTGAGDKFTVRLKYGGTTFATLGSGDYGSSATRYGWRVDAVLSAGNATNVQTSSASGTRAFAAGVTGTAINGSDGLMSVHTGGAIDSTTDQTLDITIQNDTSSANESTRVHLVLLELL